MLSRAIRSTFFFRSSVSTKRVPSLRPQIIHQPTCARCLCTKVSSPTDEDDPDFESKERDQSPYKILGFELDVGAEGLAHARDYRTVEAVEFKKAYKRLARLHHPDLNRNDPKAEERMAVCCPPAHLLTGLKRILKPNHLCGCTSAWHGCTGARLHACTPGTAAQLQT